MSTCSTSRSTSIDFSLSSIKEAAPAFSSLRRGLSRWLASLPSPDDPMMILGVVLEQEKMQNRTASGRDGRRKMKNQRARRVASKKSRRRRCPAAAEKKKRSTSSRSPSLFSLSLPLSHSPRPLQPKPKTTGQRPRRPGLHRRQVPGRLRPAHRRPLPEAALPQGAVPDR